MASKLNLKAVGVGKGSPGRGKDVYKGLVWGAAGAQSEMRLELARNRVRHVAGFGPRAQRLGLYPEDNGSL